MDKNKESTDIYKKLVYFLRNNENQYICSYRNILYLKYIFYVFFDTLTTDAFITLSFKRYPSVRTSNTV